VYGVSYYIKVLGIDKADRITKILTKGDIMDRCESHDEITRSVGAIEEAVTTLKSDNGKIFELLTDVRLDLAEALTKAKHRQTAIEEIDRKIENGLRTSIATLSDQVRVLFTCSENHKKAREIEMTSGVEGFFRLGWLKFKDQLSFIIICTGFVIIVWSVAWIVQKAAIFHELPLGLFKILGIG
jgi:hypothetical protein